MNWPIFFATFGAVYVAIPFLIYRGMAGMVFSPYLVVVHEAFARAVTAAPIAALVGLLVRGSP